jgi:major intracellular serine protease
LSIDKRFKTDYHKIMKISLVLCLSLFSHFALAEEQISCRIKPITIAIVDTGFGFNGFGQGAKLCKYGHKDFTSDQIYTTEYGTVDPVPLDLHGHGTNVAGIIQRYADKSDARYCLVIIKFFKSGDLKFGVNARASVDSIKFATNIHVDYINYSGGGEDYLPNEELAVKKFISQGGKFIAAAGNEGEDIDESHYYPAYYDDVVAVGSLNKDKEHSRTSNFGESVEAWEIGENITAYGITMTGTSQATAVHTGKMIAEDKLNCH